MNEAKLILVGYGKVGKTCLVNRLLHDTFHDEQETEGTHPLRLARPLARKGRCTAGVWELGGQEIMHATHRFFLTKRSIYLLVLSGREGKEDVDAQYWLSLINSFAEDSPVIVVLNKIREQPFAVNQRGLQGRFANLRDALETDCEDGTGIEALRNKIFQETERLPHLRDPFPAAWFAIKDRLARMKENYVSFEYYRKICVENGEADDTAQEKLASHLHNLGLALNYREDPRLRDNTVLNPHWVTEGIYRIVNAKSLAEKKGELRLSDIANILDTETYPPERHGFLMELMRRFELCFRFPDEEDRYLVADLLDKQEAKETDVFDAKACLNFEYHDYPALPEGLLPRFIVRTHVHSRGQPRWRTGVVLSFEGNRALIKADMLAKRVQIKVDGPATSRRRLLAVVRDNLEHIHDTYTFQPPPTGVIPIPDHPEVFVPYNNLLVLERNGINTLTEVVGNDILNLNVADLLNGVDLEGTRQMRAGREMPRSALSLFYSYAHKDEELRDEMTTHLTLFRRQGLIEPWHDRRVQAGETWRGKIDDNLEHADVILLLVSADFVDSDYCYEIEMTRALQRHKEGTARVIPIIVRDCTWHSAPFADLQVLPTDGRAVTTWGSDKYVRDTAWRNVADGIEVVLRELREKKTRASG